MPPSPQRVPDCQSSTAVFLSDDLSLLVCGPYVYENDTPQECLLHAKMSLSFLIAEIYVYAPACGRGFRCHNRRLVYNHVEVVHLHLRSVFLPFFSLRLLCLWEFVVASLTAAVKRPPLPQRNHSQNLMIPIFTPHGKGSAHICTLT